MTILASTDEHLAEFEGGVLTIARRTDGHAVSLRGRGLSQHFRDCLTTHAPQRVVATFLRIAGPNANWRPLYRPSAMPPAVGN